MEWILCEDRLPKNDDWKIITILDEHGDIPYRYSDFGWYFDSAKCWIVDAQPRTDVLAWMPLPKPYTADRKTEPQTEHKSKCYECEDFWSCDGQCDEVEGEPQIDERLKRLQACIDCEHTDMCEWCHTRWSNTEPQTERSSE